MTKISLSYKLETREKKSLSPPTNVITYSTQNYAFKSLFKFRTYVQRHRPDNSSENIPIPRDDDDDDGEVRMWGNKNRFKNDWTPRTKPVLLRNLVKTQNLHHNYTGTRFFLYFFFLIVFKLKFGKDSVKNSHFTEFVVSLLLIWIIT